MHKSKKKTAKLPKPIKVKKEKNDEDRLPQPMMHYMDDRLELVKQVFGSLKPKTIINLAPDFLKSQGLEEIEEACLNELLCISTKRLKSIISATRCPSDTESSEDDDVQRKEEHVSLEEISSDSEIEGGSKKVKKKKSSKVGDKEKTVAKNDAPKTIDGNADDGQISVLELLELQARARAIRSQLALEPVTKIEVDSDDDGKGEKSSKKDKKSKKSTDSNKNERKRSSSVRESLDSSNAIDKSSDKDAETRKTKKIKLKRNYRNSSTQDKGDEKETQNGKERETQNGKDNVAGKRQSQEEASKRQSQEEASKPKVDKEDKVEKIKKEKSSRSPSPDVIPIVPEPETLLIDDSSDEDEVSNLEASKSTENSKESQNLNQESSTELTRDRKESEAEEGELNNSVGSLEVNPQDLHNLEKPQEEQREKNDIEGKTNEKDTNESVSNIDNGEPEKTAEFLESSEKESNVDKTNSPATTANSLADEDEDEDRNDDIISLGEDLEDEMDEQLESEAKNPRRSSFIRENEAEDSPETSKKSRKGKSNGTSSEDDHSVDNQSWHSRYMKSSKVSKVLAASRLGKRVRDKIKKSKDAPRENSEKAEKDNDVFTSKHEDGSLEQYKELLELRQRKSK